jgi:hypothetical protein
MKRFSIYFGLILGLFVTCKSTGNQNKISSSDNSNPVTTISTNDIKYSDLLISKSVDTSKTFIIKDECVFVIQMSTKESDSLETANPDSYEVLSENANNDAARAIELFERLQIKNYWSDRRYISFGLGDKKYLIDTRLKDLAGQFCILFKNNVNPILIRIENLNEEVLTKYFKK